MRVLGLDWEVVSGETTRGPAHEHLTVVFDSMNAVSMKTTVPAVEPNQSPTGYLEAGLRATGLSRFAGRAVGRPIDSRPVQIAIGDHETTLPTADQGMTGRRIGGTDGLNVFAQQLSMRSCVRSVAVALGPASGSLARWDVRRICRPSSRSTVHTSANAGRRPSLSAGRVPTVKCPRASPSSSTVNDVLSCSGRIHMQSPNPGAGVRAPRPSGR